jgi:hypothetical protein
MEVKQITKPQCPECLHYCSIRYLKKNNKCASCVKKETPLTPEHHTRSKALEDNQAKLEMQILKKIIDIYYESMELNLPLIEKLSKANFAIDECIIHEIRKH